VHILLATDANWIVDEVLAALGDDDVHFTICREGRAVSEQVQERLPDLAVLDLQIGSMGAMAVTMALRLDESAGAVDHVPVLMLLDRRADLHLARRSGAEGWLIKPLDSLRLRRAADAVASGRVFTEGLPLDALPVEPMVPLPTTDLGADSAEVENVGEADSAEEEPATAG